MSGLSFRVVPFLALFLPLAAAGPDLTVASPHGDVCFHLSSRAGRLEYSVSFREKPVIESSPLGMTVGGGNLSEGVAISAAERYQVNENYPWHGIRSEAIDRCSGVRISLTHKSSGATYILEIRAYDDGVAFRHIVPGEGKRVPDEATAFRLPEGSTVWTHDVDDHYEAQHVRQSLRAVAPGEWALPPLTARLPAEAGYLSITEAALRNYSGMGMQADGKRGFRIRLGHAIPASYPFRLRYPESIERMSHPAAITGTIITPWRVVMIAPDLSTLANCGIVHNLSPPPDPKLFPHGIRTSWIKPGRSVWSYLDGGQRTLDGMKEFSRGAAELGFEYNLLEGFWAQWPESELKDLVDFSRELGVGIIIWKHGKQLRAPEQIREFFSMCNRTGVAGAKIDFFDHEHKDVVDLYETLLEAAAQHRLLVDFHGSNKPTGLERTWPNLIGMEGIRGMEARPPYAQHNATLPFTRMLAGLADYTPVHFGRRMADTTWAHQVATAVLFPAPLLVYAAHPAAILANPASDMIRSIPSVWDGTFVLPASEIGEVAAVARRKREMWFLAVANGVYARTIRADLSFLGEGSYDSLLIRDGLEAASVKLERLTLRRTDVLYIQMPSGGGFIARFTPRGS